MGDPPHRRAWDPRRPPTKDSVSVRRIQLRHPSVKQGPAAESWSNRRCLSPSPASECVAGALGAPPPSLAAEGDVVTAPASRGRLGDARAAARGGALRVHRALTPGAGARRLRVRSRGEGFPCRLESAAPVSAEKAPEGGRGDYNPGQRARRAAN